MRTISDFAVKPFSFEVQTHLQISQVIETVTSTHWACFDPLNKNR